MTVIVATVVSDCNISDCYVSDCYVSDCNISDCYVSDCYISDVILVTVMLMSVMLVTVIFVTVVLVTVEFYLYFHFIGSETRRLQLWMGPYNNSVAGIILENFRLSTATPWELFEHSPEYFLNGIVLDWQI